MSKKKITLSIVCTFGLFFLILGTIITPVANFPNSSAGSIEYNGCYTFGEDNIDDVSYSPGQNPLSYRSGSGYTTIISELYGHYSVLESKMSSGIIYKEEIILNESYHANCEPSPTTGVQTVEWWWAFDIISLADWTTSPTVWLYTDTDSNLADDTGVVYIWWQKPPGYNDQFICQVKSYEGGATTLYQTGNNAGIDLSDTVIADKFYHFRISFDYDLNQITWAVNGEQGWMTETWSTSDLAGSLGNITKIAFGAGFSYTSKHWMDSPSWTWSDNYEMGDLVNPIMPVPSAPSLDPILPNPDTDGNIQLNWNDVADAELYRVYRDISPITEISGLTYIAQSNQSNYVDEGLESGVYYYVVVAIGPGGDSALSNGQEIIVEIAPDIPGYNVWFLLGIMGFVSLILVLIRKRRSSISN